MVERRIRIEHIKTTEEILELLAKQWRASMHPIIIVDGPPGCGKSTWGIEYMKRKISQDNPFVYVVCSLDESKRIIDAMKGKSVFEPDSEDTKFSSLREHLKQGHSVVITHHLFKRLNFNFSKWIRKYSYELIIDEVIDAVEYYSMAKGTIRALKDSNTYMLDDRGRVKWNESYSNESYESEKVSKLRSLSESRTVKELYDKNGEAYGFVKYHYFQILESFSKVHILTFMFKGSLLKGMFEVSSMRYEIKTINEIDGRLELVDEFERVSTKHELINSINLFDDSDVKDVGMLLDRKRNFSYTHQSSSDLDPEYVTQLKNDMVNIVTNKFKAKKKDLLVTVYETVYLAKGFVKEKDDKLFSTVARTKAVAGYASATLRATNKHGHVRNALYGIRRSLNPQLVKYIDDNGGSVCEYTYTLSEMIQWIWRTAIRNGERINLCIFCIKARTLFKLWLCTNLFETGCIQNIDRNDLEKFDSIPIGHSAWKGVEIMYSETEL